MPQARDGLHIWPIMTLPSTIKVASQWQHDDTLVVKAILVRGLNADTTIPQPFE